MEKLKSLFEGIYLKSAMLAPDLLIAICVLVIGVLVAFGTKKISLLTIKKYRSLGALQGFEFISAIQLNRLAVMISRLTFWITVFVFVVLTAEVLGIKVLEDWLKVVGGYIPNIIASVLILVTGLVFAGIVKKFLFKSLVAAGVGGAKFFSITGYAVSVAIVLLVAINQVGIDINFLTSIILVLVSSFFLCGAVSFGFGSAPVVTNIISTYYIRKIIRVGQSIEVGGLSGRVIEINATSVHVQTSDCLEIVPSARLSKSGYRIKNVCT